MAQATRPNPFLLQNSLTQTEGPNHALPHTLCIALNAEQGC